MFSTAALGWKNVPKTLLRRPLRGIGSGVSYILRLVQRTRLSFLYDTMANDVSIALLISNDLVKVLQIIRFWQSISA